MKLFRTEKETKKFDLEKMEVAKLKNLHLVIGGGGGGIDPPIIDTNKATGHSSGDCEEKDQ